MSSLVAYDYSSDEDSENDQEDAKEKENNGEEKAAATVVNGSSVLTLNNHDAISDEDEESLGKPSTSRKQEFREAPNSLVFNLPAPTKEFSIDAVEEEDDEFLRIKATPVENPPKRGPVKISIPSLSQFRDLAESEDKEKSVRKNKNSSNLLSLLPKPISETLFQAPQGPPESIKKQKTLVPDSVLNRQAKLKAQPKVTPAAVRKQEEADSDDDSDTGEDFFRLNATEELPEVSKNELNVLVAKKAAQIAATSSRFEKESEIGPKPNDPDDEASASIPYADPREIHLDETALEKLCGKRAKRARLEEINFVDIRSDEVMPSQEEWMRQALANSTEMPKGKPAAGSEAGGLSKRKHQITYLASQAKANEQELQAMWAANRQTRRQTQSKYGF